MRLKELRLRNFKGIKDLKIEFGNITNIKGENGKGKTTVFDAFTWLLFDKDSLDRKNFGIKTYDGNGDVIHGLEHEVEGILEVNGQEIKLKKIYQEKWTKKRGEAEKNLTGHTTDHWINEVPVKKSDYTDKIKEILDEDIFKLITNPLYFNENISWNDRRNILMEIVGDIDDLEVIKSNSKLKGLTEILGDKSIEDIKKIIAQKKKAYNKEIEQIPVRIDEIYNNLPSLDGDIDYEALEGKKALKKAEINKIENELTDIQAKQNKVNEKMRLYNQKTKALNDLQLNIEREAYKQVNENKLELSNLNNENTRLNQMVENCQEGIERRKKSNEEHEKEMVDLRAKWDEIYAEELNEPDRNDFNCPTCKQQLPSDDIENKIMELRTNFDKDKKDRLESINNRGISLKKNVEKNKKDIDVLLAEIESYEKKINDSSLRIAELEKALEVAEVKVDYESNEDWKALKEELKDLGNQLDNYEDIGKQELLGNRSSILSEIEDINTLLNNKEVIEKSNKRVEELKLKEKDLADKINELEKTIYLIEEFTRSKVELLENKINSKFKYARFKLFNQLVNGALEECCETVIDGVPYSDLNKAAKYNSGLDIINTLTKHYGVTAPVFIDNRESVNNIVDMETQVINLIVSKDKKLKMEVI